MPTYKDIEYILTRRKRKTASIHIERDGSVSLIVPDELSDNDVDTHRKQAVLDLQKPCGVD